MCCATSTKLGWRVHAHCVLSLEFSFQKSQKFLKSKKKRKKYEVRGLRFTPRGNTDTRGKRERNIWFKML